MDQASSPKDKRCGEKRARSKLGGSEGWGWGVPREQMEAKVDGLRAPHTSVSKAAVNFAEKDGQGRGCSWTCWVCWGLGQLIVINPLKRSSWILVKVTWVHDVQICSFTLLTPPSTVAMALGPGWACVATP